MASTGIVKPLPALRVRDFDEAGRGFWVPDTKNAGRPQLLDLHPVGAYVLALLVRGNRAELRPPGTLLLALTGGR